MSHLLVLDIALRTVYQWFPLGMYLGLSHLTLKTIERLQQVESCRMEMLATWLLKGPEEKRNKQVLQNALEQLTPLVLSLPPNTSAGEYRDVCMLTAQQTNDSMPPSSFPITSSTHVIAQQYSLSTNPEAHCYLLISIKFIINNIH